jgi:hypothetical protein
MTQTTLTVAPRPVRADGVSAVRKSTVVILSVLAGLALAVLWSANLVDNGIGENVANQMLGYNAKNSAVSTGLAGMFFAFVAGFAGTFTACNVACFSAIGPMLGGAPSAGARVRRVLPALGWLSLGLVLVAAVYGAIGAAIGDQIPQLSNQLVGNHVPLRVIQAAVVFTVLGFAFLWLGLAAIRVVPDPLARWTARWSYAPSFVLGMLMGGFLIGRPYPLFFKLFQQAAHTHNPLYGAVAFILTALGNVIVLAVVFLALSLGTGGRYERWLAARPGRIATLTACALIIGGAFMVFYWGVRLPARFDYGWFPTMPWK